MAYQSYSASPPEEPKRSADETTDSQTEAQLLANLKTATARQIGQSETLPQEISRPAAATAPSAHQAKAQQRSKLASTEIQRSGRRPKGPEQVKAEPVAAAVAGRRRLPDYEADVYGPLPFSEEVTGFLDHELRYLLKRQNENGSWDSAEPTGGGRTRTEAGGTVDNITLTSMCGVSLRNHVEIDPEVFEESIARALSFVTYMISSGKLRNNVSDAPWRYVYALRFLIHEYPHVDDRKIKKQVEDACAFLVEELKDIQQGTPGRRAFSFDWNRRSSPGLRVEDTDAGPGRVVECEENTPAFDAGIRKGDRLLSANEELVDSALRYAMSELYWKGGDTIEFKLLRAEKVMSFRVPLPRQYPGTLGLRVAKGQAGLVVEGFDFLCNPTQASLKIGDRILKVDQREIATLTDLDKLTLYAGQEVELSIQRGDKTERIDFVCALVAAADFGVKLSASLDQSDMDGFRIIGFRGNSCLAAAGLRRGDRLLRLDGALILNRRHFKQLSRSLWGGKKVQVTYLSSGQKKQAQVTAGSLANRDWLAGYHGLRINDGESAILAVVEAGSPASMAGCERGDQILDISGTPVKNGAHAKTLFSNIACGKRVVLTVRRDGVQRHIDYVTKRRTNSVWIANSSEAGGGWEYYSRIRGGSTFLTSDALRELLAAKRAMPQLDISEEMLFPAFRMLSKLRKKQPNGGVDSYRYDAGGSFWSVKDIRGDVGRLNSAELACLMYSDTNMKDGGYARSQTHLEKALEEWLKHRGILDLVKFPKGHSTYSIAPYFWMYSYRTTLEAADYLTTNDDLKERVRRISLKAFFKHMEFRFARELGEKGWILGQDGSKELHDSCQLLDGLATMKHLYRPALKISHPALSEAMKEFYATRYGAAHGLLRALAKDEGQSGQTLTRQAKLVEDAIQDRFETRLADVKLIHEENPYDGQFHLEQMQTHFEGYPRLKEISLKPPVKTNSKPSTTTKKTAEKVDAEALVRLAYAYRDGRGRRRDYKAAVAAFSKAAEQG